MRPHPSGPEPLPPSLPAAIERFDELTLASRPPQDPLREALSTDSDLARRLDGRELPHGRLALRACLANAALERELERPGRPHPRLALRRARLHGLAAARLGRMARVNVGLPALELELVGPLHELGVQFLPGSGGAAGEPAPAHAHLASELAVAWGLSGALAGALENHHGSFEGPSCALLALSEHLSWSVARGDRQPGESPTGLRWSRALGLTEAELARAVERTSSDWAGIAA